MEIPQKPKIKLPEGYEIRWNNFTNRWSLFCVEGYSKKILPKKIDRFIPQKGVNKSNTNEGEWKNKSMNKAKIEKYDEFYTRKKDIAKEVKEYKEHFKNKIVYCPCDKAYNLGMSNFFAYFATYFKEFGLKKLICTQYNPTGKGTIKEISACTVSDLESRGIKWEWSGENGGDKLPDESEIPTEFLMGDGSFDSYECRKIMMGENGDGSDVIVVTNPPFSKFKEFISQLIECKCKFLILGNQNAVTYKEVFPLLQNNQVWLGFKPFGGQMYFHVTDDYKKTLVKEKKDGSGWKEINGEIMASVSNVVWFTNLDHSKRRENIYLSETYLGNEKEYPILDNMNSVIDIGKWKKNGKWEGRLDKIPKDYNGIMSVPISFLSNYNPEQFEIIGSPDANILPSGWSGMSESFVTKYYEQGNTGTYKPGNRLACFIHDNKAIVPFKRVLIKKKSNI